MNSKITSYASWPNLDLTWSNPNSNFLIPNPTWIEIWVWRIDPNFPNLYPKIWVGIGFGPTSRDFLAGSKGWLGNPGVQTMLLRNNDNLICFWSIVLCLCSSPSSPMMELVSLIKEAGFDGPTLSELDYNLCLLDPGHVIEYSSPLKGLIFIDPANYNASWSINAIDWLVNWLDCLRWLVGLSAG